MIENLIKTRGYKDRGIAYDRVIENRKHKYNKSEEAFIKEWKVNANILHGLFNCKDDKLKITVKERFVVATMMQWLGTNCGMSFLRTALNKCGYDIVERDFEKERIDREKKSLVHVLNKKYGI